MKFLITITNDVNRTKVVIRTNTVNVRLLLSIGSG